MKSQVSMEFLTGVAVMLFIYALVIGLFGSQVQTPMVKNELGRQICYSVARTIDSASSGGAGFSARNTLPQTINGDYYWVLVSNDSLVSVYWDDKVTACSISTQNITKNEFYSCSFAVMNTGNSLVVSAVWTDKLIYNLGENITINGGYFPSNASLKAYNETNVLLGPIMIVPENGFFEYVWSVSSPGEYTIYAEDPEQKSLNSKTEIIII